jgi:CheY-like chemotaxis protein
MLENEPAILVIDDDEIALAAMTDLLEAAEFRVCCRTSPAGAADIAAANPALLAVVLDLNMPIMRGDNVARVFMSRASLRDLPMILVSGDRPEALAAVRRKMPHVKVVAKVDMERHLVAIIKDAVTERSAPRARSWGSQPVQEGADGEHRRGQTLFLGHLAHAMTAAREMWHDLHARDVHTLQKLGASLRALHCEADRRALLHVGQLLRAVEQVVISSRQGAVLPRRVESAVGRALEHLATIETSPSAYSIAESEALIESLRRAERELRTKSHSA